MPAEFDEPFGYELSLEKYSRHVAYPDIVHRYAFGEWQGTLADVTFEGHTASQIAILDEKIVPKSCFCVVEGIKRGLRFVELPVGDRAVAHHTVCRLQGFHHNGHFVGHPYVVLVGQEDVVALCSLQGVLEVGD